MRATFANEEVVGLHDSTTKEALVDLQTLWAKSIWYHLEKVSIILAGQKDGAEFRALTFQHSPFSAPTSHVSQPTY